MVVNQDEKCEVRTTCISRVCCYILARGETEPNVNQNGKQKNPTILQMKVKWESRVHTFIIFFFKFLNTSLSLTSGATRTAGFMDTLHMHTHMTEVYRNRNEEGTDVTSRGKSELRGFVNGRWAAAKQR